MATGQVPLKILVPAGVGGAALFLYTRQRQTGHLRLVDWLIGGSIVALSVLAVCVSWFRTANGWGDAEEEEDSEDSWSAASGLHKRLLVVLLLPLFLWVVYSNEDLLDAFKKPEEPTQAQKAMTAALASPRTIRTLAGEPDQTGWVPASSTAGGFSVSLPDRFNEVIVALKVNGRLTPVVLLGAETENLRFVALAARWTGATGNLKARVQTAAKSLCRFKNPVVSREGVFEERFPLMEIEGDVDAAKGLTRIIATDQAVYGLAVEGPELTDEVRADAGRFFDSFAILAPEPNEAVILNLIEAGDPNQ